MAKPTIDGIGQAKLQQLASAASIAQTVHGLVEKYAIAMRGTQPTTAYPQMIKRAATPLIGLLRSQFQLLADIATDLILVATRSGGGDQARLRALRERVGQLKSGIALSVTSTTQKHSVHEDHGKPPSSDASGE